MRRLSTRARAARARRLAAAGVSAAPAGAAPAMAGYHKLEAQQFRALDRETKVAVGGFTLLALVLEPIETLFGLLFGWLFRGDENEDDEPAPDYSMAERIPEEER